MLNTHKFQPEMVLPMATSKGQTVGLIAPSLPIG